MNLGLDKGRDKGWDETARVRTSDLRSCFGFQTSSFGFPHVSGGYTLIEYLVYMAVFAVVLAVAFSAFYQYLGNFRDLARNSEDILQALDAGELWRADMRQAIGVPEIVNEEGLTAFEIPKTNGPVAYILTGRSIWRKEGEAPPRQLLVRVKESHLVQDRRERVTAWRWELELLTKKKGGRLKPLFTFQAVPLKNAL